LEEVVSFLFKYRPSLFSKGELEFATRAPAWLVVLLLIAAAGFLYVLYLRSSIRLPAGWRTVLICTRFLLLALILVCLARPVLVAPSIIPQASYVAVLLDDSSSMLLPDESGQTRLETVKRLMASGTPFFDNLSKQFKLRTLKFSETAERVAGASQLTGSGSRTNLAAGLEQAVRDSAGIPFSGIVLVSDGAANSETESATSRIDEVIDTLRARGVPVYTVGVGPTQIVDDVEMIRAAAPRRSLSGSPVTAELLIRSAGSRKTVKVDVTEDQHPLRSQEVPVQDGTTSVARVTFTPSTPGFHRYGFSVAPAPEETVPDNNSQDLVIEVEDSKPRVLYIEGEPRWEYGKLRAALSDEKNVVLVSVLRSADGKFYRQGVESGEELANGFPKSEEDTFKYDALILGSIEATFFTYDQLHAIEQFVSRRGGTLLVLGGSKALGAGGYANTTLADLLPLYLRDENGISAEPESFKAQPSERGKDSPVARLGGEQGAEISSWEKLPPVTIPEVLTDPKPGATVILEGKSIRQGNLTVPLLVEERYGRGRTLALLASDTWRWRMMIESRDKTFETFWRNLTRYLVESVRRRVETNSDRCYYGAGATVMIRAEVADEKFLNVRGARVSATVLTPNGRTADVPMKEVVDEGLEGYAGRFVPAEEGFYRVEATAHASDNRTSQLLGSSRTGFLVGPLNVESHNAAQNRELLKRIATDTGGKYYVENDAGNIVEDMAHTEGANSIRINYDLWDMPINFLMVVALAGFEWFARKRKGLS
jgi:uncharacterized membrane protein